MLGAEKRVGIPKRLMAAKPKTNQAIAMMTSGLVSLENQNSSASGVRGRFTGHGEDLHGVHRQHTDDNAIVP